MRKKEREERKRGGGRGQNVHLFSFPSQDYSKQNL